MAISFDAASQGTGSNSAGGTTNVTVSHTIGASATILVVFANVQNAEPTFSTSCTGVTWNGTPLTLLTSNGGGIGGPPFTYCFYLLNPTPGTQNIVGSFSFGGTSGGLGCSIDNVSYNGVTAAPVSYNYATGGSPLTTTLSVSGINSWTVLGPSNSNSVAISASTGSTSRTTSSVAQLRSGAFDSNGTVSGTASMTVAAATATLQAIIVAIFTPSPPTVTTPTSASITETTATLGGDVTSNGGASLTSQGITWDTTPETNAPHANVVTSGSTSGGVFTVSVSGLPIGTTIYFNAYATNSVATTYSVDGSFTTFPGATTFAVTGPFSTSGAVGNGSVSGSATITANGVCVGTSPNPTLANTVFSVGSPGPGNFNVNMTGLTANTLYHVVAYATNSEGTSYGSDVTFTTQAPSVASITPNSAYNDKSVSITSITGVNFVSGCTVALTKTGQTSIPLVGFTFVNSGDLTGGTFAINGAQAGLWNVVVTNPDSQTATLSNGFTILASTVSFLDFLGKVSVSGYKWLTSTLQSAQNQFTVRPALSCQIIDRTLLVNQQIVNNITPPSTPTSIVPGSSSDSCTAPDGSLLVVTDDTSGNLRFGKITNGNTTSQWTNLISGIGTIIANVSTGWIPYISGLNNTFQLNASISCSGWINGNYTIDIFFFKNNTTYEIIHSRSTDSGSTFTTDSNVINTFISVFGSTQFIQLAAGTPVYTPSSSSSNTGTTSCTVFFLTGLGNTTQSIQYSYSTTGSMITSFNGEWSSQYSNSGDWILHSFDVEYINGIYYVIFSGYQSTISATNSGNSTGVSSSSIQSNFIGNFGLYMMQINNLSYLDSGNPSAIWSEPRQILTFNSSSSSNYNQILYPSINYDGTYLWTSFRGDFTSSTSGTNMPTVSPNYYISRSLDFKNFDYPTTVTDTNGNSITGGYANGICRYIFVGNQGGYYYLLGSDAIWQYIQNEVIADVSNDIISVQIQDQSGGASSLNLTINNASGKWAGSSPTGTNYQAIWKNGIANKNSLVYLNLGYYTSTGGPEYVPRNVYYIQDITQNTSSNQNDLVIVGQDFNKLLSVTQTAFTYSYQGPDFYFDPFTTTTIANWSSVSGTWYQSPVQYAITVPNPSPGIPYFAYAPYTQYQLYNPVSATDGQFSLSGQTLNVLSGYQVTKSSLIMSCGFYIPLGATEGVSGTGAEYDFYPLYINSDNYIQVQIIYNGTSSTANLISVGNGVSNTQEFGAFFTLTDSNWYPIYINCYNFGNQVDVMIGLSEGAGGTPGNTYSSFNNVTFSGTLFPMYGGSSSVYSYSGGINPSIAIGTNGTFGSNTTSDSTIPTYALFANLRFSQYTYSQNTEELTKKLGTLAHIFNYIPEEDIVPDFYTPSQWNSSGTFSLTNRRINLGGQSFALQNVNQSSSSQIEFDAKVSTSQSDNFGFDLILNSQDSSDLNNCYKIRFMNSQIYTGGSVVKCSLLLSNSTGSKYDFPLFSSVIPDQLASPTYYYTGSNNLNIDLTQWNHYQVMFNEGWFSVWVNYNMVFAWYDNNYYATYSSGYWGFSTVNSVLNNSYAFDNNETLYVKNIKFPTFWQQNDSFTLNPGDDLTPAITQNLQTVNGWFFSDLGGRFKIVVLKNGDPVSYYYGDEASNYLLYTTSIDSSDKEYYNQVLVVGDGVSYLATDSTSVGSNGILREEVIVDYTITTLSAAMTRGQQELSSIQKYGAQPAPQLQINVGSEIFDVVNITDQSTNNATGLNGSYRLYTQSFQVDNQSNYNITLGAGTVSSNS